MISSILSQLNPEQREAVETIEGPLLVLAGAGTGKTRVITYRIAYMIEKGIPAENILAMTFTNKAAREMKERLSELVSPSAADDVTVGTFHAFCAKILRQDIRKLDYLPGFSIIDESDQKGLLRQAIGEAGFKKEDISMDIAANFISKSKNSLLDPDEALDAVISDEELKAARVYARYQKLLQNQNMVDFDDLLFFVFKLWRDFPDVLEKYRNTYRYILVDEYQDTNDVQFNLIKLLTGDNANLCVVGDDDQSIYGWRGAVIENILNFPKYFPGTKEIKLEQNYRSTDLILQAANKVIKMNSNRYDKNLWSGQKDGESLKVVKHNDEEAEADFIADVIQELVIQKRQGYDDFAILYRSNHLSRQLEQSLRKANVPYRMVGSRSFYQRREIKDAVAYLRLLVNPREDQSLLRIMGAPPRGLGDKAVETLKQIQHTAFLPFTEILGEEAFQEKLPPKGAQSAKELSALFHHYRDAFNEPGNLAPKVQEFLKEAGYLNGLIKIYRDFEDSVKRQENVYELINAIAQFEKQYPGKPYLRDFVESFALLDDNDKVDEEEEQSAVTLTTVHAAKGLEYPYVFLIGLEHNVFPNERAIQERAIDEERRLFYVAITRAKANLVITHCGARWYRGQRKQQRQSMFVDDLPGEVTDMSTPEAFFTPLDSGELADDLDDLMALLDDL